jgi:hypothetical protein
MEETFKSDVNESGINEYEFLSHYIINSGGEFLLVKTPTMWGANV